MNLKFWMTTVLLCFSCSWLTAQVSELKPGEQSPDFQYEDMNGKVYSLKDFKGKYVLIDFWASYCAPCKKEIPHLKALEKKLKKKKIVFVSISIDMDKEEWLRKLKEEKLEGIQLIFNRSNIEFIHQYQVTTIPRYILLDKEGKIVNHYMPRPSDPEMLKILKSLKGL